MANPANKVTTAKPVDVSLPNDREIVVTREFDAPASLIWDCHTKPELVRRWMLGPDGWSMPVCEIELRVGGRYRYRWKNDADGSEFGFRGEFKKISAPTRLEHTELWDTPEATDDSAVLNTVTLTERAGKTTLVASMLFPSKEARDQALGTGMTDGMATSYERLERVMAEGAPRA